MAKKHVEGDDVKILARVGRVKVNEEKETLRMSKGAVIGIKTWGRIDFLTNHRGWSLVKD